MTNPDPIRRAAAGRRAPRQTWRPALMTLSAALAAAPVPALQVLDARDGVAVEAVLSIKEPTRIRIDGAPITDVFGNLYSSNCGAGASGAGGSAGAGGAAAMPAVNPGGEVVLECDREKGEIYIRPVGNSPKPVNLFVSSAQATYTLVLRKADTPADTIVIRDRSMRDTPLPGAHGPMGPSAHHIRAMKSMLVAMASDRVPPDIRVDEVNRPVRLWAQVRFTLMRQYEGRGLFGERYLLHNVGDSVMVLAEPEFDRPDGPAGSQVLGVSIEHHNLRPSEVTNVFVIRRGGR